MADSLVVNTFLIRLAFIVMISLYSSFTLSMPVQSTIQDYINASRMMINGFKQGNGLSDYFNEATNGDSELTERELGLLLNSLIFLTAQKDKDHVFLYYYNPIQDLIFRHKMNRIDKHIHAFTIRRANFQKNNECSQITSQPLWHHLLSTSELKHIGASILRLTRFHASNRYIESVAFTVEDKSCDQNGLFALASNHARTLTTAIRFSDHLIFINSLLEKNMDSPSSEHGEFWATYLKNTNEFVTDYLFELEGSLLIIMSQPGVGINYLIVKVSQSVDSQTSFELSFFPIKL